MKIALIGAELEENLGLRYMTSMLECHNHQVQIVPFNSKHDSLHVLEKITAFEPRIVGMSMVFTSRAHEFCRLVQALRDNDYHGHIIAGGHFAALNCERLLQDFPEFDSVALGEGEEIICALADHLDDFSQIDGLCYRKPDGTITINPSTGNPDHLDALPFPKRTTFREYFDKPVASILSSRGCWRNCAFCSINAWYKSGGGKKFRTRSAENIVAEMKELYFDYGVRIFNFQDDNFFLPDQAQALQRFKELRAGLQREGVNGIAIAVKARPDSITRDSTQVLDDLGLFRVFLGVENASEHGLRNLNRKCSFDQILNALQILNDFDVHIAYNLLMFEPDTIMDDILINLHFIERHMQNPFNFCRAEAYAGTGLESKLRSEDRLLGDYFGFDYRLKDPHSEVFHQIANYAFFDRNFSDFGLHYFNMQVDFYFQLLRRFYPQVLTQSLRGVVRSFIKRTNLDTYMRLCEIYDFVTITDPINQVAIQAFAKDMRRRVDARSRELYVEGERIQRQLGEAYERRDDHGEITKSISTTEKSPFLDLGWTPYHGLESLGQLEWAAPETSQMDVESLFGVAPVPVPYHIFKRQLDQQKAERG